MRNILIAFFYWSALVWAADVTGSWSGSMEAEDGSRTMYLVLKQEGDVVTGTGGPDEAGQLPVKNGKAQGEVVTFEISTPGGALAFELKTDGDGMTGTVQFKSAEGTRTAKVSAKRLEAK